MCRRNKLASTPLHGSSLDQYKSTILEQLALKAEIKSIYELVVKMGHTGKRSCFYDYCKRLVQLHDINLQRSLNILGVKRNKTKPKDRYIGRSQIFKYLWSNFEIPAVDVTFLLEKYPLLKELKACITDFRSIYVNKSITFLEEFVVKYESSSNKNLKSFTSGLAKDIEAVKNSVTSQYSNGFIEGNNNRLKMIKRMMYGRASLKLLRAKIIH
ncbi:MAG: transposase [Dehalobacterium sp.]